MAQLNTDNPQAFSWTYEEVDIAILGGVKLEGLDRLRVTLKIEYRRETLRHNLDLYNEPATERLVRRAAEKFAIGTAYLGKVMGELTNELEGWRITQIEKLQTAADTTRALSAEEQAAAKAFLTAPALLPRISEAIGAAGVVGEEGNRLLMFIIFSSRKREHPLHIISLASSGAGKSYLQETVSALIPEEDKVEITVLSENAFYYFGQRELKHKLILIEDLDGASNALYPLRELQSKKRISKTVAVKDKAGNTQTIHLTVEGPLSVAGCTTREQIYEDNANRSFLIYLDESAAQDERIMARQRQQSAGLTDTEAEDAVKDLLKNAQRLLGPITIRNPYAPELVIPAEVFKPRRSNAHYLQFIEAITFLKQHQRPHKTDMASGEVYIESTLEDIKEAGELLKDILLRKSDELNGATRAHLEGIKDYLKAAGKTQFGTREIRAAYRLNPSNQKRYMAYLLQTGYLKKVRLKSRAYAYEVVSYGEYGALQSAVDTALDTVMMKLEGGPSKVQSSDRVHSGSEPLKAATGKGISPEVQKTDTGRRRTKNTGDTKE